MLRKLHSSVVCWVFLTLSMLNSCQFFFHVCWNDHVVFLSFILVIWCKKYIDWFLDSLFIPTWPPSNINAVWVLLFEILYFLPVTSLFSFSPASQVPFPLSYSNCWVSRALSWTLFSSLFAFFLHDFFWFHDYPRANGPPIYIPSLDLFLSSQKDLAASFMSSFSINNANLTWSKQSDCFPLLSTSSLAQLMFPKCSYLLMQRTRSRLNSFYPPSKPNLVKSSSKIHPKLNDFLIIYIANDNSISFLIVCIPVVSSLCSRVV